jgi:hypothetical protein
VRISDWEKWKFPWETKQEAIMKIAVELDFFGQVIAQVVEYPGTPQSQGEVIQWLMNQTDYKWASYDCATEEDRLLYHLHDGTVN